MNRMYLLQHLYLAKKKESKIIDLSILNENEKLALLELYKREYERTHPNDKKIMATEDADDNDQTSDVSNLDDESLDKESEMQIEDVDPQEENIESQETKLVEEDEVEDEIEIYEVESVEEDEVIEVMDFFETDSINDESEEETETFETELDEDEIEMVIEDPDDIQEELTSDTVDDIIREDGIIENGNESVEARNDAFEYSSFTPYKPKYDDMTLTNNMFMSTLPESINVEVDNGYVEKYKMKTNTKQTNVKVTKDGLYKVSDSYNSNKEIVEVPTLRIVSVILAVVALGLFVVQFVYNYEQIVFADYAYDFVYCICGFALLLSIINQANAVNSFKGAMVLVSLGVDFIYRGVGAYQDGLYKVLNPADNNDLIYGILLLVVFLMQYSFFVMCAVATFVEDSKVKKVVLPFGIVTSILMIVFICFENVVGVAKYVYDAIPNNTGLIVLVIALAVSSKIKKKRR